MGNSYQETETSRFIRQGIFLDVCEIAEQELSSCEEELKNSPRESTDQHIFFTAQDTKTTTAIIGRLRSDKLRELSVHVSVKGSKFSSAVLISTAIFLEDEERHGVNRNLVVEVLDKDGMIDPEWKTYARELIQSNLRNYIVTHR